jgi:hypothetical protein
MMRMSCFLIPILIASSGAAAGPIEATISVIADGPSANPTIIGTTNLPDGTNFIIIVENRENKFLELDKVIVQNGHFQSQQFSRDGHPLQAGTYSVNVQMPAKLEQPESVMAIIGSGGANLTGSLVRRETNDVTVNHQSSFTVPGAVTGERAR